MPVFTRMTSVVVAACASALVIAGGGIASAQTGSLGFTGSAVDPVFDSKSEAALTPLGGARYRLSYINRADRELACVGVVMPEELARKVYDEMQGPDFEIDAFLDQAVGFSEDVEGAALMALDSGHLAFAESATGLSYRDYLRAIVVADNPGASNASVNAVVNEFVKAYGPALTSFGLTSVDQKVVNFVREGALAKWDVRLPEALPAGEKAGGVVSCFDGLSRQISLSETTYVEIEHAAEGAELVADPATAAAREGAAGALSSSGLFGS